MGRADGVLSALFCLRRGDGVKFAAAEGGDVEVFAYLCGGNH